jgi:feruloyl esterase
MRGVATMISALSVLQLPSATGARSYDAIPCEDLTLPPLSSLEITSVQGSMRRNITNLLSPDVSLDVCNITVSYNHEGEDDITWVNIWLPLDNWNGRFQATGGGGLAAGFGESPLLGAASSGYSTGSSDGGLTLNHTIDPQSGKWALRENGVPNESLIKNFATRAIHDMTVIGKSLTETFYGQVPAYS